MGASFWSAKVVELAGWPWQFSPEGLLLPVESTTGLPTSITQYDLRPQYSASKYQSSSSLLFMCFIFPCSSYLKYWKKSSCFILNSFKLIVTLIIVSWVVVIVYVDCREWSAPKPSKVNHIREYFRLLDGSFENYILVLYLFL